MKISEDGLTFTVRCDNFKEVEHFREIELAASDYGKHNWTLVALPKSFLDHVPNMLSERTAQEWAAYVRDMEAQLKAHLGDLELRTVITDKMTPGDPIVVLVRPEDEVRILEAAQ